MKFPYLKQPSSFDPSAPWTSRPYIPVRLFYENQQTRIYALIDSGADITLFHSSIAKTLGLDYRTGRRQRASGIASEAVDFYFHTLKLQIVGAPEAIGLQVGFTDSPGVSALLGQAGFFDHYRITFDRSKDQVEILPVSKGNGHSH